MAEDKKPDPGNRKLTEDIAPSRRNDQNDLTKSFPFRESNSNVISNTHPPPPRPDPNKK